jgi:mannose-6-phosphate isomerase-like protein (cupin superfamily)
VTKALVVREEDVVPFSKGGRDFRVLLSPSKQSQPFALGTAVVHPMQSTPCHTHETEYEAWYVVSGHGIVLVGDDPVAAWPGTVVVAPPGVPHQLVNGSPTDNLKCLVVFSPAGPEEAFIP